MNESGVRRQTSNNKITNILILKEIFTNPGIRKKDGKKYRHRSETSIILICGLAFLIFCCGLFVYFHFVKNATVTEDLGRIKESALQSTTKHNTEHHTQASQEVQLAYQPAFLPVKTCSSYIEPVILSNLPISRPSPTFQRLPYNAKAKADQNQQMIFVPRIRCANSNKHLLREKSLLGEIKT